MQNNTKNVCRFCLKLVHSANVGFLNDVMRKMMSLLLIKLDFDVSNHTLVCSMCSEVLDEIFSFKSRCLYIEDIITAQIEISSKVSLRDILIEIENKRNIHIGEDEVVCRLCIKIPLNGSYIALGETCDGISFVRDMIQIHLPEMDLSISEKPIICDVCHVQLKKYVSFATNCMDVEEKIKLYCDLQKISGPVDLARVLQFMEDKALNLENRLNEDLVVKQEVDSLTVKVEKVQDAESYILEGQLVDSRNASELYLKNEEIEIKSENDEMVSVLFEDVTNFRKKDDREKLYEVMEDSVPTVATNNSGKSGSLKRKRQITESPSTGRKHLSCDDHSGHRGHNKRFGCEKCGFMTRWKANLNLHIMLKHRDSTAERTFKCDKCPYKTDIKSYLDRHNPRHKDKLELKMYRCANCEFKTRYRHSLNQHILKHRDPGSERKFKCDKCQYETVFKFNLNKHNLGHKDKSEVEMHKCDICEYETRYKRHLFRHNLVHKDKLEVKMYKCANCEFETRYRHSLIQHLRKHRNPRSERKFKCDKCQYKTDCKSNLNKHNQTHKDKSEVKMYKCEGCEFETRYKCNMITHMLNIHKPNVESGIRLRSTSYSR